MREDRQEKKRARGSLVRRRAERGLALAGRRLQAVFFVDGRKGDAGRHLHCVSTADGAERWKLPVAADASGEFVLLDHGGLIADGPQQVTCFRETGEVAWRADCGAVCGVPAASDALLAVATERPPALLVLDRPERRRPCGACPWTPRRPPRRWSARTRSTWARKRALPRFRLADGGRIWEAKGGPPSTPLVLAKNRLAYVNAAGELVVVGLEDGHVEKTLSGAWRASRRWPRPEPSVYATKKGLMSYHASAASRDSG